MRNFSGSMVSPEFLRNMLMMRQEIRRVVWESSSSVASTCGIRVSCASCICRTQRGVRNVGPPTLPAHRRQCQAIQLECCKSHLQVDLHLPGFVYFTCACMWVCRCTCVEDNVQESVLPCNHMAPGEHAQAVRLGGQCPYLLSCHTGP